LTKEELRQMRRDLGMTQAEFGEWLAGQVNALPDSSLKPVSPYTRQRVHAWETGDVAIPMKIENVVIKRQLEQKDALIAELKQKQRQKP